MVKKCLKGLIEMVLIIILFISQIYIFNKVTLFGVKANIILVTILIISMIKDLYISIPFSIACGLACDILFTTGIGKYIVIYLVISLVVSTLIGVYKKGSKGSIIILVALGTTLFELLMSISYFAVNETFVNVIAFIFMTVKEAILNVALAYIVYIIISKLNIAKDEYVRVNPRF